MWFSWKRKQIHREPNLDLMATLEKTIKTHMGAQPVNNKHTNDTEPLRALIYITYGHYNKLLSFAANWRLPPRRTRIGWC